MGALFFNSSCKKDEPETVTETITITDTLNVDVPVAVVVNSIEQDDYGSGSWALFCTVHYNTKNLSSQDIDQIKIRFEVTTVDGSTYSETAYVFDLDSDKDTSGSTLISVGSKEAKSVKVDEIEVTIY